MKMVNIYEFSVIKKSKKGLNQTGETFRIVSDTPQNALTDLATFLGTDFPTHAGSVRGPTVHSEGAISIALT